MVWNLVWWWIQTESQNNRPGECLHLPLYEQMRKCSSRNTFCVTNGMAHIGHPAAQSVIDCYIYLGWQVEGCAGGPQDHPQVWWFNKRTHRTRNHGCEDITVRERKAKSGKGAWGEVQSKPGSSFPEPSPCEVTQDNPNSLRYKKYNNPCERWSIRAAYQKPNAQDSYWGPGHGKPPLCLARAKIPSVQKEGRWSP